MVDNHTLLGNRALRVIKKGHHISSRLFFLIDPNEISEFRNTFGENPYSTLKGTRQLHQIYTSDHIQEGSIMIRKYSCLCDSCVNEDWMHCSNSHMDMTIKKVLPLKSSAYINEEDINDDETTDDVEWEASDAVQMIQPNDIVVIRSGDDFNPYYLLCATTSVMELIEPEKDQYGYTYSIGQNIIKGHYLEEHKQKIGFTEYFKDETKKAIISSFCIAGIAPVMKQIVGCRRKKTVVIYEVTQDIHEILIGLV